MISKTSGLRVWFLPVVSMAWALGKMFLMSILFVLTVSEALFAGDSMKLNFFIPYHSKKEKEDKDPMHMIQLCCPFAAKTVKELKAFLLKKIALDVALEAVMLIYCNTVLDDSKSLEFYGITDYANLVLVMKDEAVKVNENEEDVKDEAVEANEVESQEVKDVKEEDTKTETVSTLSKNYDSMRNVFKLSKEKSKDPITLEEVMCYKLPCGHLMNPESLFEYCEAQLKDGKSSIVCPDYSDNKKCEEVIDYFFIRQILKDAGVVKSEKTLQKMELMGAQALLKDKFDVQRCAQCVGIIYRNKSDEMSMNAVCPLCSVSEEKKRFCWRCAGDLKDGMCGNPSCSFRMLGEVVHTLATCETKTIGSVNDVPAVRSCVECSQLITHIEACKHMQCKCGTNFCFVCLGKYTDDGGWRCGSSSDVCEIAPRQTAKGLPSGNKVSVDLFHF